MNARSEFATPGAVAVGAAIVQAFYVPHVPFGCLR